MTDSNGHHHQTHKTHWRPLFFNTQSLTPTETRYGIQQKIQQINDTSIAHSTILTLAKVTEADEGLYMCKSLSPKTIQMAYLVRVIRESFIGNSLSYTFDSYGVFRKFGYHTKTCSHTSK